jgi:hypothetical protein
MYSGNLIEPGNSPALVEITEAHERDQLLYFSFKSYGVATQKIYIGAYLNVVLCRFSALLTSDVGIL